MKTLLAWVDLCMVIMSICYVYPDTLYGTGTTWASSAPYRVYRNSLSHVTATVMVNMRA